MRSHRVLLVVMGLLGALSTVVPGGLSSAAPTDVGYRNPSFAASGVSAPTGQKPQSKLWFNDNSWWGALFSVSADAYTVWKLDSSSQTWADTGVVIDPRNAAQLDVLFDGSKLYTLSADVSETATSSFEIRRYSYSSVGGYQLDAGFPQPILTGGTEAAVFDKDSLGQLWVTYVRAQTVYVMHSTTDDFTWGAPYVVPAPGAATLTAEDQSTIVAYGGRIGVMWSNQNEHAMYFASHVDGAPDNEWTANPAIQQSQWADDHMNVKADASGRVFAVTKTSLNAAGDPLIVLSVLGLDGVWTTYPVANVAQNHTRPIVVLDEDADVVYVFASSPCCSGGIVYYKSSPMSSISFTPGLGTPMISSSFDPKINNATSTKQYVGTQTGLVVLAGDDSTKQYLHNTLVLGGDTTAPDTAFSQLPTDPSGGTAQFEFFSNESAATFECQLDAGAWVGCVSPHSVSGLTDGAHTLSVRATDAAGNVDATPAVHAWNVVNINAVDLTPTDDTYVVESQPGSNFGNTSFVDVDGNLGDARRGLIKFDLSSLAGTVTDAKLRLYVTNGTGNGPVVYPVASDWQELTVNWSSQPAISGPAIVDLPAVVVNSWLEIDVTAAAQSAAGQSGVIALSLVPQSSDGMVFVSSENTPSPVLHVVTETTVANTTIESAPPTPTTSTDAAFEFSGTGTSFECRLDAGSWAPCTSPVNYSALSEGTHQFEVRSLSVAGPDPTPATFTWSIDTTPPTVVATNPAADAIDVPIDATVTATFSEDVAPDSITSDSFRVLDSAGAPVAGTVTYDAPSRTARFQPAAVLVQGGDYQAEVSTGVRDVAGNATSAHSWVFTTSSAALTQQFAPVADARVEAGKPTNNFGSSATLTTVGGTYPKETFIKFDVAGIGNRVDSAVLRLYVTNASVNGPEVTLSSSSWSESTVNWNNRPSASSGLIADASAITATTFIEYDVTSAIVHGSGVYSFRLSSLSTDSSGFNSRQAGSNRPELIIVSSNGAPDSLPPDTSITSGPSSPTLSSAATFELAGEPDSLFECSLDGSLWAACSSPYTLSSIPAGSHELAARAVDRSGNVDPSPALWNWTVSPTSTTTIPASADTYVNEAAPTSSYGAATSLYADGRVAARRESLLRFDVGGVSGTVVSARLRVFARESTVDGPQVFLTTSAWTESAVNWNNRPAPVSVVPIADAGGVTSGTWYEFDLTGAITGDGVVSFVLISSSSDRLRVDSREAVNGPQLVIVHG